MFHALVPAVQTSLQINAIFMKDYTFFAEHAFFCFNQCARTFSKKSTDLAIGTNHTMTRHLRSEGIPAQCLANSSW